MRLYTKVISILLLGIGIAGFVPGLTDRGGYDLLGFILVNPAQSVIHILGGLLGLGTLALNDDLYVAYYTRLAALGYTIVALWGLPGLTHDFGSVLFGLIHVNWASELIHLAIAIWGLYAGFGSVADNDN